MLTRAQLKRIQEIINRRFLAFTYEALGERALTSRELQKLKDAGLLRRNTRNMIGDPYTLGKIAALTQRERVRPLTYDSVMKIAHKMKPLTDVERAAINYAKDHAGEYITGIGSALVKEVGGITARSGLHAVRREVAQAVKERKTTSELKTALYAAIDDKYRDWQRVASTEMNDAIQNGIYNEIRDNSDEGDNQLVYKRPAPDACKYCKAVYLMPDGITPKIFRLTDLSPSNIGKKAKDWEPTVGSVHPWCQCQLHPVLDGFSFEKRWVVNTAFRALGKEWKPGMVVQDADFDAFSATQRGKLREDAVLAYTGKTPKPVKKSEEFLNLSENDCVCRY